MDDNANEQPGADAIKDACCLFATGVAIAGCFSPEGRAVGLTINSFVCISLSPPLLSWSLDEKAHDAALFLDAKKFGLSVLREDQRNIARHFAASADKSIAEKLLEAKQKDAPLLKQRLSGFTCRVVQAQPLGDHILFVGRILHCDAFGGQPLLYQNRDYRRLRRGKEE